MFSRLFSILLLFLSRVLCFVLFCGQQRQNSEDGDEDEDGGSL